MKKTKAKKPAKRIAAKPARKSAVKKAKAKKPAKRIAAKKAPLRKTTARKPATKKTTARKPVTRPAKKPAGRLPVPVAAIVAPAPKPVLPGLLGVVVPALEDAKAEAMSTIDLQGKSTIADWMVVANGRSNRHVAAIAEQLVEKLKAAGQRDIRVEGLPQADWVLVDAGDVVVHLFRPEVRSFYNLEKLWSEHAPRDEHKPV